MKKLCLFFCLLAFGCAHSLEDKGSQTGLDDFQDGDIVNATKLNAIKNTADAGDAQATTNAAAIAVLQAADANHQSVLAEGAFEDGDKTKLDGIEDSADVTDATNVEAAGAAMVAGDVYSGTHDFGAAVVEIPNGTNPTADDPGEIAHDTTADQIVLDDNVFHPEIFVPVAIENLAAGDDNYEFFIAPFNMTVTGIGLHCRGTCTTAADISLEDRAGNAMTHGSITPSTGTDTTTFYSITAANSLIKGEGLCFDVDNAVSPETDVYTFTVIGTVDRQ
jgi:hypothetical protein